VDARTGKEVPLETPTVGGWNSEGGLESAQSALKEETTEEVDRLVCEVPRFDAGSVDWGGRDDLPRAMLAGFGQDLYPIAHITSPLWGCYPIWGFEGLMAAIADKPDLVRFAGERLLARSINAALRAAALGAKAVWIEECITDQISPASFESINVPVLRRLVGEARAAGLKTIYYYCGDPAGKLDLIRSIGADALSFEESKKGFRVDIEEMADMIRGECVLLGNLDAVGILENGTERELRAEIERQMSAGRRNGGRFIMSLGSPVTPDTPPERVRLYCDIAHEVGASSPA
jgi:uroporphyrinogen-III decarboxylase